MMIKKTSFIVITVLLLSLVLVSCKYNKVKTAEESNEIEAVSEDENSLWDGPKIARLITENETKYPQMDLKLFDEEDFQLRLKALTGNDYDEIIENFNTETPIVSDNEVYKFTGCREHDCPSFFTTVLYDAKNANMNVVVSKNGKVQIYEEKGKITTTKTLRAK